MPAAVPQSTEALETAQRLRIAFGKLSRALRRTEAGAAAGLTPARVSALLHVERRGRLRLSELAEAEGINPTMLSRMVADLVAEGLLTRSSDPEDRRAAWVEVTDAGAELSRRMRRERTEAVEAALADLGARDAARIEAALPALERLAQRLREGPR
jgi:DNA-binding MarR family transcriptional regulator